MQRLSKYFLPLAGILVLAGVVYSQIPGAYFCAYDDFLEVHRAAFEDTRDPARVFTTTHFNSYKYRPFNRGFNLLTYWAGEGGATFFRARNVAFHLLNIVLVYCLGLLLFGRRAVAAVATLLFGLHPLANQAVVGAVMTNTAAHTFFLLSVLCFLLSQRGGGFRLGWLCLGLVSGWVSLLTYEAAVAVYPLMLSYLVVHFLFTRRWQGDRRFLLVFAVGSALLVGSYFALRALYVPYSSRQAVPGAKAVSMNAVMYAGALVSPVDSVLANEWLGTPLPSELALHGAGGRGWGLILGGLVMAALLGALLVRLLVRRLERDDRTRLAFLALCVLLSLAPLLVFTDKASETYMYLPVAFSALLFSRALEVLVGGGSRPYAVAAGVLCVLFACGTWVRNERVVRCGETARKIVSGLPQERLRVGHWLVIMAGVPGSPQSRRYGMYGWRGIDTVGVTAVQSAAQLASDNEQVRAAVVEPEALTGNCTGPRSVCLWVGADGEVSEARQTLSEK